MNLYEFLKNKTRRVKTMDENEVIDNEIEMTPEMKALLARADRVIKNGSRYLDLK